MPKTILWLASYPKSGNTWLRLFLFNYIFNFDQPAPINQAHRLGPSDATADLYRKLSKAPFDPNDHVAALRMRMPLIRKLASNGADVNFVKTHNVNDRAHGFPLIPADLTRGAIYVIRDPLDMALSYAHHFGYTPEKAAIAIGRSSTVISADSTVVHQYLGGWSRHVRSWVRAKGFETCVIRYEDMKAQPEETFGKALRYVGAPVDEARLEKAIRFSSFDEAKKQETEHGFVEKPKNSEKFFRSGKVGEGREELPQSAIDRIVAEHGETMKRYGYLS